MQKRTYRRWELESWLLTRLAEAFVAILLGDADAMDARRGLTLVEVVLTVRARESPGTLAPERCRIARRRRAIGPVLAGHRSARICFFLAGFSRVA